MSFIIDEADNLLFDFKSLDQCCDIVNQYFQFRNSNNQYQVSEQLLKNLGTLRDSIISITLLPNFINITFHIHKVYKNISALLFVFINNKTLKLRFGLKLLNQNSNFVQVDGRQRKKIICKYLNSRWCNQLMSQFQISIDFFSGEVKLQIPTYYIFNGDYFKQMAKILQNFMKNLGNAIKILFQPLNVIIDVSNSSQPLIENSHQSRANSKNFNKQYDNFKIMNIFLCVESQTTKEEKSLNNLILKQNQSIYTLRKNYVAYQKQINSVELYVDFQKQILFTDIMKSTQIDGFLRQNIKTKIQLPYIQKSHNPNQNFYVLNYIKVNKKLSSCPIKKINSGGFTDIYLAQIQYWYVGSYSLGMLPNIQSISNNPPHKKCIIIKRQNKAYLAQSGRSRVAHEKMILTKIKNGVSMFLPKYYILAEKDEEYQNDLLLDYIQYPNLYTYCIKHKETMSMHTKIYFSIMIAQSLRYLAQYKIVHLDLKPTNIMTNRKLNIKLIDFGQSFHPELKNHQPGFSMPYSSPENYSCPETYDYKNDVFSLGIIMYEFFIGKYPFFFHSEQFRAKVYQRGNYYEYWFHTFEENKICGDSVVFPLIQGIIIKCLHPNSHHRPELEWIVYILRQCLDYFY